MKNKFNQILLSTILLMVLAACSKEPKVIAPTTNTSDDEDKTGIFSQEHPAIIPDDSQSALAEDIHSIVVLEALPTVRYVYLRVREEQDEFWIATIKRQVNIGATYFYQGGLLKTNFESKEHKRVFDRMYLVSSIIEAEHSGHAGNTETHNHVNEDLKYVAAPGSIKIADLVAERQKYEGKFVQVSGECVKINPNIMGRNWVHLQDGSGNNSDLLVTCDVQIPIGHRVTMRGKVVLNKDFGSGYQYSILLEDGKIVP